MLSRSISRRQMLAGGMGAALLALSRSGRATAPLSVPTVDRLTIKVLVDNATFGPFLSPQLLPGLKIQRRTGDVGPRMSADALRAEFGLSVLGISQIDSVERRVLMDFGYTAATLANNMALLGVDPRAVDAAVLSHGHLDHYGGFAGLFAGQPVRERPVPLIVGGEEVFCERVAMLGNPPPVMGTLDRAALARAGFAVTIAPGPLVIAGHGFTSGVIPLRTRERAAIPTVMRPGKGCDKAGLSPAKQHAESMADDGEHELALCYAVRELGLVVISSCSHRGVLNAVRQAQAVSGISKVHAVIGGFHLVRPRTEEEARQTAAEFAAMGPVYIVPMHCTGEAFIEEAMRLMPGKVVRPYVGTEFVFET